MPPTLLGSVALVAFLAPLAAQQGGDVFSLSLEELQNTKIAVASIRDRPIREQPAVVTVITQEQIQRMGATDLADILKTVPGFWIQSDIIGGVLTPSFRGFAGGEGKILLRIDGIEQNDNLYGAPVIGQRIAAANIQRIEIVRGPGSARYGGNAELAVISIYTKGSEVGGFEVGIQTRSTTKRTVDQIESFHGGTRGDDWSFSASGHINRGTRMGEEFTGTTGFVTDPADSSQLAAGAITLAGTWHGVGLRFLYDSYEYNDLITLGAGDVMVNRRVFDKAQTELSYEWKVSPELTIRPRLVWTREHPWGYESNSVIKYIASRYMAEVEARWDTGEGGDLLLGGGFYRTEAELRSGPLAFGFDPATHYGDEQVHHNDYWLYAQYDFDMPLATVSAGVRYEDHSEVGDELVPRLALTRVWDAWHSKLMYSRAFRVPQIETINSAITSGGSIRPETLTAYEFELGYNSERSSATGNLFLIENDHSIVYDLGAGGDRNGGTASTFGGELEVRHEVGRVSAGCSVALYQVRKNEVPLTVADGHSNAVLGVPEQKLAFDLGWQPEDDTTVTLTTTVVGRRWAWRYDGSGPAVQALRPEADVSLQVEHHAGGLTLSAGLHNLLDTEVWYAQPYNGGLAPVPGHGRTLLLSATLKF